MQVGLTYKTGITTLQYRTKTYFQPNVERTQIHPIKLLLVVAKLLITFANSINFKPQDRCSDGKNSGQRHKAELLAVAASFGEVSTVGAGVGAVLHNC